MPSVTVRPADGGKLITRAAAADAGAPNYTVKRGWRRDLSDEVRREGWDYFLPLSLDQATGTLDYQSQPFPAGADDRINLIHMIRRPNGEAAVIAGTPTTLYRFMPSLDGYVESAAERTARILQTVTDEYVEPGYWETVNGRWQVIGSGFSENGRRWEVLDLDGTTVFNNGVDLPVAMRVEWRWVKPLYELREQGIVSVGTICEFNGMAFLGDITEFTDEGIAEYLDLVRSDPITVSQSGYRSSGTVWASSDGSEITASGGVFVASDVGRELVLGDGRWLTILSYSSSTKVTVEDHAPFSGLRFRITDQFNAADRPAYEAIASGDFFTEDMVGQRIGWSNGTSRRIVAYVSPTKVLVDQDVPVVGGVVFMDNPNAYVARDQIPDRFLNRRQYRLIRSELSQPTRYGVQIPAIAATGTSVLLTKRTTKSFAQYDQIAVVGAGDNGGVLVNDPSDNPVTVISVAPGSMRISTIPRTSTDDASVSRLSAIGSTTGYDDLQGDGSTILKMGPIQSRLVVYKDTDIFVGRFTGNTLNPMVYEQIKVPHGRSLFYRNTLVLVGGTSHVFAGKSKIFEFNLTSRVPQPIPDADLCGNVFYDYAKLDDTESIFAVDNHLTQEIWLVCPRNPTDPVLAYDYTYRTFSTIDYAPTAAASIKEAVFDLREELGDWFLMGTASGAVLQYGLVSEPTSRWVDPVSGEAPAYAIYYRRSERPFSDDREPYVSELASGLTHFGDTFNDKHLRSYVLQFSSLQRDTPAATVSLYSSRNQSATPALIGTRQIIDANSEALVPVHSIAHFFKDVIVVDGVDNPTRLHSRTFEGRGFDQRSFSRRPE